MIRKASVTDVQGIFNLVNEYAKAGEMLPKSLNQIYESLRDFVVLELDGTIRGCGALHICWDDLGEIRSLAVHRDCMGQGYGREMVKFLLEEASILGLKRVFALTYKPEFFEKFGFKIVDKETLPHKIWKDCVDCLKFPHCDEIAVIYELPIS